MTAGIPRVTVHMVSSLDGFIARKDGSLSWLESSDTYEHGVVDDNTEDFLKTIDCFVMGSRTYEHALELSRDFGWPYGDVPTFVLTRRDLPVGRESVRLRSGDVKELVEDELKPSYGNIWLVGGAALVKDCLRLDLVDDIRQMIVPIILGDGTLFFDYVGREQPLHLKEVTAYKNGMVELWYEVRRA